MGKYSDLSLSGIISKTVSYDSTNSSIAWENEHEFIVYIRIYFIFHYFNNLNIEPVYIYIFTCVYVLSMPLPLFLLF